LSERLPVILDQSYRGSRYFPASSNSSCSRGSGVKAASHLSGGDLESADTPRADVSDHEKAALRALLQRYVPAAAGEIHRTSLCVYTRSPDEHFVLGQHPEAPQIVLASPCSGHGFKLEKSSRTSRSIEALIGRLTFSNRNACSAAWGSSLDRTILQREEARLMKDGLAVSRTELILGNRRFESISL
jgi:hypothetical protein